MPQSRKFNQRAKYLLETYNITENMFNAMYFDQDGKCAIESCVREATHIDHDHNCCPGKKSCGSCVRALLCDPDNRNLGMVENENWLKEAQNYLSLTRS